MSSAREVRNWYEDGTRRSHESNLASQRHRDDQLNREAQQALTEQLAAANAARQRGDRINVALVIVTGLSILVTAGAIVVAFVR